MAGKNEYKASKSERKEKRQQKKKGRKESAKKFNPLAPFQKIEDALKNKRIGRVIGVSLILFSFYLLVAFTSYIFTWKVDQDIVLNKGFFEFIFSTEQVEIENWLGKLGAYFSHLFIYKWFGLASYGFIIIFFNIGMKLFLKMTLIPFNKLFLYAAVLMTWSSIALGYVATPEMNYLGGAFGYFINDWIKLTLGNFGGLLFVAVLGVIGSIILFNPKFENFFSYLRSGDEVLENESSNETVSNEVNSFSEQEEEDTSEDDSDSTIEDQYDKEEEEDDDDSELEEAEEDDEDTDEEETDELGKEVADLNDNEEGFSVEIAEDKEDEELSDEELHKKVMEQGEFDPTLELSSYQFPGLDLFEDHGTGKQKDRSSEEWKAELEQNKNKIIDTLENYNIEIDKIKATVGPTVTLYEIVPAAGVRISKIQNLEKDIALSLAALGIRIIAPIPGRGTVGIEVPNSNPDVVSMRSLIASRKFQEAKMELPVVMGKTISNETYTFDLTKMPHLLVAGATGQGKSVGLNAILVSLLYKKHPSQLKFVLVDPKKVELTLFNKIERHFLAKLPGEDEAIITDTSKVVNTLNSLCIEMDDRYDLLKEGMCRNIKEYNQKFVNRKLNPNEGHRYLPYIVVVIDEFADLIMTAGKEVEHPVARLAQLARAIGIHLIVATQRPSTKVITGNIKANFPARIAFRVLSQIDSRTILDSGGAEQLIGRGDMLISTGQEAKRLQCGFVDTPEVDNVCSFIGDQRAYPSAHILPEYVGEDGASEGPGVDLDERDALFDDAASIIVTHQQGSASLLQRKLKIGYNRAGRIIDQLEAAGIIGPFKGSKAREVLISDEIALRQHLENL